MRQNDEALEVRLQLTVSVNLWLENDETGKLRHVVRRGSIGNTRTVAYEAKTHAALVAFVEGAIFWAQMVNAGRGADK